MKTRLDVYRRSLHILALLQNPYHDEQWNSTTLADLLSLDDPDNQVLTKKNIDSAKAILRGMGYSIPQHGGGRNIPLDDKLDEADAETILFSYLPMVVHQMSVEEIVKSSFSMNPGILLYLLARIYFSAKEKRVIELVYCSSRSGGEKKYILHPYGWVYREQSIYLVAYNNARTQTEIFRITRISSVRVLDQKYSEEPGDIREVFLHSGGVFVGRKQYPVIVRALAADINLLTENFGHLDASIREAGPAVEYSFSISDLYWLCQRLLPLGGRVKLIGSAETAAEVRRMMDEAVKNFF